MKSKILFLLHLPPPVHGSSIMGQYVKSSRLINEFFESKSINLLGSESIEETGKFKIYKVFKYLKISFQLFKHLILFKPQLCYFALSTTGTAFLKDLILILFIKAFKVKLVYHLHNKGVKKDSENKMLKSLYRFAFKNTDVILLSNKLYYDIEEFVPINKIHICHNGIPDMNTSNKVKTPNNLSRILFLSNLLKAKGIFVLLEALAKVQSKGFLFDCMIVGGEGDVSASMLENKIKHLNLTNSVKYLGRKYGEEKVNEYTYSDFFVLPTYYSNECFPLVLLEAMSFSLPIISTVEGGIEDIVNDGYNGFLIEKNNVGDLADKIESLIQDRKLRFEMGINSRQMFKEKFSIVAFDNTLLKILLNLLKQT